MLEVCTVPADERKESRDISDLSSMIARMAKQEPSALEQLYKETHTAVFAYALSILKNRSDAEDVLHDCMLQVWSCAASYRDRGKPMAWILTITRNLCLMRLREEKNRVDPETIDPHMAWNENSGVSEEDHLMLQACMNELEDTERAIIILHAVAGLRHREIAKLCQLPLSTVLSKYSRGIQKIRKLLTRGEENE